MRVAQIYKNKAWWIFETSIMPNWPNDSEGNPIILVDITKKSEVREGWDYDVATGIFTEPFTPEPLPEQPELSPAEQAQLDNDELLLDMYLLQLDTQLSLQTGGDII